MLKKNDFIEVDFTARTEDGKIFDSTIKSDLESANLDIDAKPFVFPLGQGMFLKGVDDFLIGKNVGKYNVELEPEDAFGKRDPKLIQMIPMKVFVQHKINPVPGASLNFDGKIAKILTVSGGRVMVDFNNPIAGKKVTYNVNILRRVEDINEKAKALINFLFRKDFEFEIKDKKLTLKVEKQMKQFAELFKDKFKEILGLDLEVEEIEKVGKKKKEEKPEKEDSGN